VCIESSTNEYPLFTRQVQEEYAKLHVKNISETSKPYVAHGAKVSPFTKEESLTRNVQVFIIDSEWMQKFKKAYYP
jgi:hypothetical protein